jgi:xanthine/CO dehydrogenase XdhC/CoxF family maturation factor
MKEFEQILALWSQLEAKGESAVLATVVKTSGSAYRLPGARLLLARSGQRVGSVSGGCLEDDLLKRAWWLTENGPVVRRYDTTPDGEIAADYGLGCNGIIHVLLERLEPGRASILDSIRQVRETRTAAVIEHVIAPANLVGHRTIPTATEPRTSADGVEIFTETLTPALRLLIFGAGDDAVPLVTLAKFLGWEVFVFDGRAHYARRDKFPNADNVIVRAPGNDAQPLPIDAWTAAVLMSHSYSQDSEMLKQLAGQKLQYLGILGPRKRALQMLSDAGMEGVRENSPLHTPMGLDIGADGPQQVALSVVAEIQAVLNGRRGGLLRERAGAIHSEEPHPQQPQTARAVQEHAWVQSIVCA